MSNFFTFYKNYYIIPLYKEIIMIDVEKERSLFEYFSEGLRVNLQKTKSGEYTSKTTQKLWKFWVARAKISFKEN